MSTTIDQKVVEMRFDNRHFESNARESMSTLEKLKQKLNLSGASKGLENLNTSANKVNMNGLSGALDTVHSKFSAMEIMGITALANITNSAVNAGKRIVSALTIDPVKDGFNEYEMMLNTVQTTMAATGKTAKEVEKYLKDLDDYADKTVYSTADMLNNLPKFTNAGVELADATTAMIGIANATARAGGDASKASIAFYNLGQAIGTGYLTRMDYNSINNAGIATMEWKNQMVEAAIAAGTLKKVGEDSYKAGNKTLTLQQLFIDGLQEQWATTDVMMSVFKAYGDETTEIGKQSYAAAQDIKTFSMMMDSLKATAGTGWKDTWQIIFGDLDEAKELWTGLNDFISRIIEGMANFRNYILESALGRSFGIVLDKIKKPFKEIEKTVKTIQDYTKVVDEIISGKWGNTEKRWNALTEAGYDWKHAQNLVNERLGFSLRRATDYNESQQELVKTQEEVNEATTEQIINLMKLSDAELKAKGYTDEQIEAFKQLRKVSEQTGIPLKEFIKNIEEIDGRWILLNSFKNIGQGLVAVFGAMKDAWLDIFPLDGAANALFNMIAAFHKFTTYLTVSEKAADKLRRTFRGLFAILDIVLTIVAGPIKLAFKIFLQLLNALDIGVDGVLTFTAKLGDAIVAFHDWFESIFDFTEVFKIIAPYIKAAASAIGEWFKKLKDSELVKNFTKHLKEAKEALIEWLKGLKETDNIPKYIIQGLINGLKAGVGLVIDTMFEFGRKILEAICKVLGIHSPSTKFFEIGQNIIQGLVNGLKNGASSVWNFIKYIGAKCVEIIKNIDFGKLLAAAIGIGMIVVVKNLLDVLKGFAAPLEGLGEMFDGIGDGIRNFGSGIKKWGQAKLIRSIAESILILSISVLLLSRIPVNDLTKAVAAIVVLGIVIGALTFVASKAENIGDIGKLSVTFLSISGALLLMAGVFKTLSTINSEQMDSVIKGFAAMIIGMIALVASFGLLTKGDHAANIHKVGAMIRKIAVALLIMVVVVKLASMLDKSEISKGMLVIAAFTGFVLAIIAVSKIAGTTGNKTGSMIAKMSIALLIMIGVIKLASKLEMSEIKKGLAVITALGIFFSAIIAVSYFAGQHAAKAGTMMLMMSAALAITVTVIKQISTLKDNDIKKATPVLVGLGVFFSALVGVSHFAGKNALKAGAMLLMMSGAMAILVGLLFLMTKMDMTALHRAAGVVSVLEILFGGLVFVSKYAENSMKSLIVITVAIALLIAAVIGLTFIDPKKLSIATANLSAMMLSLSILIASTKSMGTAKKILPTLLSLIGVVGALAGIVYLLSGIDAKTSLSSATAISILLLSLTASLTVLSYIGPVAMGGIGALAALTGVVAGLALILGVMDGLNVAGSMTTVKAISVLLTVMSGLLLVLSLVGYIGSGAYIGVGAIALLTGVVAGLASILVMLDGVNPDNTLKTVRSLSELLMAMSLALVVLGVVGLMGPGAFIGIAALATLIIGLGAVVVAIGALANKYPMMEKFLNKGIPILEKIGYALGSFVGNIVGGFLSGATSGLPAIGKNLSAFMNNLSDFITGADAIDVSIAEKIGALSKAVLMLTGVDLSNKFTSWLTGESSLSDFGSQLADLGKYMSEFVKNLGTFNESQTNTVTCATKAITALAKAADQIPGDGGLWEGIVGRKSLAEFGDKLPGLGLSLNSFVTNLGTFSDAQVSTTKCASNAIVAMAEAADKIPNEGGWAGAILGENSIADFGNKLPGLGINLNKFVANLGTFSDPQVATTQCAGEAIVALANAASELPNEGGLVALFTGDNDISKFGDKLPGLGTNLKQFITNLGSFGDANLKAVDCAGKAILTLSNVASELPNEGGLVALFTGDNDISKFGDKLPGLAKNLSSFIKNIGTCSDAQVASVNSATNALKAVANLGKINLETTGNGLSSFGDKMVTFATKIKSFATEMNGVSSESIDSAVTKVEQLAEMMVTIATSKIESLTTFSDSLKQMGVEGVKGFVNAFKVDAPALVSDAVTVMLDAAVKSIRTKMLEIKDEFDSLAKAAVSGLSNKETKDAASQAGKDLATGFANGIKSQESINKVTAAGTKIGKAALTAAKNAIDSHSPSKEAMKIGNYFGQGLVIGIEDYESKSYAAGYGIADNAREGLSKAISKVSNLISNGIDAQPTIRPVLDLSEVESGAGYLSTMFNDPSVGVATNLNAISRGMNNRIQNGTNNDVVSAINKLRKDLGNVGGTTNNYNVNGVTYDDGSNITDAVRTLVRAARVERRV